MTTWQALQVFYYSTITVLHTKPYKFRCINHVFLFSEKYIVHRLEKKNQDFIFGHITWPFLEPLNIYREE